MSENIGRYNVILELLTKQTGDLEKIQKDATGLQGVFNRAKSAFAGIMSAQTVSSGINAIKGMIGKATSLAATFETTSQSFSILLGDMDKAKALVSELTTFAIKTPFGSQEIQSAAKTLLGFGRTAKEVVSDIELIGNAAAATGAPLNQLGLVFGQVAGVGKLVGNDVLQFINAGIPIFQILADSMGKSVSQVKELQSQGAITFDVLRAAFAKASEEGGKFYGALEKQSETWEGISSTIEDNFNEVLKNVGQAILPIMKDVGKEIITLSNNVIDFVQDNQAEIVAFFQGLFNGVKSVVAVVAPAITAIAKGLFVFLSLLKDTFKIIQENRETLVVLGGALLTFNSHLIISEGLIIKNAIAAKAKAAADAFLAAKTNLLTNAQRALNLAWRANPIGLIVTAVLLLVAGFVTLYKNSERVREITAGVVNVFKELWDTIKKLFIGFDKFMSTDNPFERFVSYIKNFFINGIKSVFTDISDIVSGEDIKGGLLRLAKKIINLTPIGWAVELGKKVSAAFTSGVNAAEIENELKRRRAEYAKLAKGISKEEIEKNDKEIQAAQNEIDKRELKAAEDRKAADIKALEEEIGRLKRQINIRKAHGRESLDLERQILVNEKKILDLKAENQQAALDKQNEIQTFDIQRRRKAEIDAIENSYALLQEKARKNFIIESQLSKQLQKIEYEKNIAILKLETSRFTQSERNTKAYIEKQNALFDLMIQYENFTEKNTVKDDLVPALGLFPVPTKVKTAADLSKEALEKSRREITAEINKLVRAYQNAADPRVKEQLFQSIEEIKAEYNKLFAPQVGREISFVDGLVPTNGVAELKNRLDKIALFVKDLREKIAKGDGTPTDLIALDNAQAEGAALIAMIRRLGQSIKKETTDILEDKKKIFGFTEEDLRIAQQGIDVARDAFSTITDIYISELDKRIAAQQDRVAKATEIAEKGNADQLALEQARLDELTEKREKALKRQNLIDKAAAQAQIIVNTALTLSNLAAGAAKVGGQSGLAAFATVPGFIALMGGILATVGNLFKPPSFITGTEEVMSDPQFAGFKRSDGTDGYWARFDGRERIVDPETNKKLKGIPNYLLPRAVEALQIMPYPMAVLPNSMTKNSDRELGELKSEIIELRKSFENLKIDTKVDINGFTQTIVKQIDNVIRRKTIKG